MPLRFVPFLLVLFAFPAPAQLRFVDRAQELGVDHVWGVHVFGGDLGGGVALFDLDGDFDLDLFLASQDPATLVAFRNDSGAFVDNTTAWGLDGLIDVKQILFADFDNDGLTELFLSRWELPSLLLHFDGGMFVDRSAGSGLQEAISAARPGQATGASVGDIDHDGDLDLYLSYWKEGARGSASANRFYRNQGALQFAEGAAALGLDDDGKGYQPVFRDLSGDGWPDLVLANDKRGGLRYWENDGAGTLIDRTQSSGLIGRESNTDTLIDGMGISVADYNGDGRLDLYATNIFTGNVLYRNDGDGSFTERAVESGTLILRTGWGTVFLDADQDGWADLAVANFGAGESLLRNNGLGSFLSVASGDLDVNSASLGMAAGDLDGDGDLDLVRSQMSGDTALFMNESVGRGHWTQIQLIGRSSNRDGVGARVTVRAGGRSQVAERFAGDSYLSFSSPRLHFGLGSATSFELQIDWPSGARDIYEAVEADRLWFAREEDALLEPEQLRFRPGGLRLRLANNPASPFDPRGIEFSIDGVGRGSLVRLQLLDLRGRSLLERTMRAESTDPLIWSWDGCDRDRDPLPNGVYVLRASAGHDSGSLRVTLLR